MSVNFTGIKEVQRLVRVAGRGYYGWSTSSRGDAEVSG